MIILLAGPRGSGKSTIALTLVTRLTRGGIQAGGVICPGIFKQGQKTGITCSHISSGHEELLGLDRFGPGNPVPEFSGPDLLTYGRWEFRLSALGRADDSIVRDMDTRRIVFVDEIGPLELKHGLGLIRTLARLDGQSEGPDCAMVVCVRQDLVQSLTERWPGCSVVGCTGTDEQPILNSGATILQAARLLYGMGILLDQGQLVENPVPTDG